MIGFLSFLVVFVILGLVEIIFEALNDILHSPPKNRAKKRAKNRTKNRAKTPATPPPTKGKTHIPHNPTKTNATPTKITRRAEAVKNTEPSLQPPTQQQKQQQKQQEEQQKQPPPQQQKPQQKQLRTHQQTQPPHARAQTAPLPRKVENHVEDAWVRIQHTRQQLERRGQDIPEQLRTLEENIKRDREWQARRDNDVKAMPDVNSKEKGDKER